MENNMYKSLNNEIYCRLGKRTNSDKEVKRNISITIPEEFYNSFYECYEKLEKESPNEKVELCLQTMSSDEIWTMSFFECHIKP
jgi:chemotaxis methyl-accepting protein methylase